MLFFQFEVLFYLCHFVVETAVGRNSFLYLRATVYHGAMVATAHELPDARCRHLGMFLGDCGYPRPKCSP